MKTTSDDQLDRLLRSNLAPPPLEAMDDAALEALLDKAGETEIIVEQSTPRPVLLRWQFLAAAAAILVLLFLTRQSDREEPPTTVSMEEEASTDGDFYDYEDAMIISTPPPREDKIVTIDLHFPKPMFHSGPVIIERPHLEKPATKGMRHSFDAPEGTRLLSKEAKVTSSETEPTVGDLSMITDGNKEGTATSYVELGPGSQWVQIDLKSSRELWAIAVWHYHKQPRAYDDVIIEMSDDPNFKKGVAILLNNDHDNSSGMGKGEDPAWVETNHGRLIDAGGIQARYVRLFSNGNTANDMNHYVEVEVYGR